MVKFKLLAFFLGFGLICPEAKAIIFLKDSKISLKKLDQSTYEAGLLQPAVCLLNFFDELGVTIGSGVLVGKNSTQGVAYVLTSAHNLTDDSGKLVVQKFVKVSFDSKLKTESEKHSSATRIFVHPEFEMDSQNDSVTQIPLHDLAIVEIPENLVSEIEPVELYEGKAHLGKLKSKSPQISATIVGYGFFGTNQSSQLDTARKKRSGQTIVSFAQWRGQESFRHFLWMKSLPTQDSPNAYQFATGPEGKFSGRHFSDSEFSVKLHPQQAAFGSGDSGGPLLFSSKGTSKVAGIASLTTIESYPHPTLVTGRIPLLTQRWEPVSEEKNLAWIKLVLAGSGTDAKLLLKVAKPSAPITRPVGEMESKTSFEQQKLSQCAECGATGSKLQICGRCKKVHYCGSEHQKSHWKKHKLECTSFER